MSSAPPVHPQHRAPLPVSKMVDQFEGVNLRALRQSIGDQEFAWLENLQPIGNGNLRVVPAPSATLATIAGTVVYSASANISGTDYIFTVMLNGAMYVQPASGSFTPTQIATVGFSAKTVIAQWKNAGVVVIDPVNGYWDYNITGANVLTLIAAGTRGTSIATYAGRVWIGNNRTVTFTDVDSYNSFAGAGGAFTISDDTLRGSINDLAVANGFLYIVGSNSFDILGNVQVAASVTTFTRQNVTASIGTDYPLSVFPYYRGMVFGNQYGFFNLSGSTPQKLSANLDRIMPAIDFTQPISGGQVVINNVLCAAFCFTFADSFTSIGGSRPILAIFFDGKWFFASQGANLKLVVNATVGTTMRLIGWNVVGGNSTLTLLFYPPGLPVRAIAQTKLWDDKKPFISKNVIRASLGINWNGQSNSGTSIAVTTDNEFGSQAVNNLVPSPFPTTGYTFNKAAANTAGGKYVGLTIDATVREIIIPMMGLQYVEQDDW
jgi:hypothetical protein